METYSKMSNTFLLNNYSKSRFLQILFYLMISSFLSPFAFLKYGNLGAFIMVFYLIIVSVLFATVLPKYLAKAVLEVKIEGSELQFNWIKPYRGSKLKPSVVILLNEIKFYKYESSRNFNTLKLTLHSGKKIRFNQWYLDDKDDYDKFIRHLSNLIKEYNQRKNTQTPIIIEKSLMENRSFLIMLAVIIGIVILGSVLLIIFKGVHRPTGGLIIVLGVFGGLIWTINEIIKRLRKM